MGPTVVSEEELLGMFERLQDEHKRALQMLLLCQVRLDKATGDLAQANARLATMEQNNGKDEEA